MEKIACFDNGGESLDRFTLISLDSGDMYGASERPFSPLGFGEYCGNPAHTAFVFEVGAGWIGRMARENKRYYARIIKRKTAQIVQEFKDGGEIGQPIPFEALPPDVQQFAKQSL